MRRLVVTGKDTPEHFRILFGVEAVPGIHAECRKAVLMSAGTQEGSPSAMMSGFWDQGCPTWSPRPANEAEKEAEEEVMRNRRRAEEILDSLGM